MGRGVHALLMSWFVKQEMKMMLTSSTKEDLTLLGELMQSGQLRPVVGRTYKFNELPEAVAYLETGHAQGKVAVSVE